MSNEVHELRRRLDGLVRSANRIRAHTPDLFDLGWAAEVTGAEKVAGGREDHSPSIGDPRARHLFERIAAAVEAAEATVLGLERDMLSLFYAGGAPATPTRGSLIAAAEHARLLAAQRARDDTPARLVDQPAHPSKGRP